MTPGATRETVDGMSMGKIDRIIDAMRHERYRFLPVRRVHIPKPEGKTRPLGLPSWSDKLVGEVVRLLLEAYYEPTFSDRSHGFRPGRGCHTALREVANTWTGTTWFIEADIADCFGSLDHQVMLEILGEKIHDERFLRLVGGMLTAGYLEDWTWDATLRGSPRRRGITDPVQHLSAQVGCLRRTGPDPGVHPRPVAGTQPAYRKVERELARPAARRPTRSVAASASCSACPARILDPGYRRLRYCATLTTPSRVRRTEGRSPADQATPGGVPA